MYSGTHDYSAAVVLTEISLGFAANSIAVTNQSASATLQVSTDGATLQAELGPGGSWATNGPFSSVWIARASGTGELLEQHLALVEGYGPPPEPTPPDPPPPPPPPEPDPFLEPLKQERIDAIDRRTTELISAGFLHAGKRFSLSDKAQIKWAHAFAGAATLTAVGAFPLVVNTIDDLDSHSVADAAELAQIQLAILGTGLAHLGSDAALKIQVRAVVSVEGLYAIVDTRGL